MSETGRSLRDRLFNGEQGGDPASKARDIVKERYARGEIDRDQYLQMLKDLDDGCDREGYRLSTASCVRGEAFLIQ
jgi:hypothetical protein